MPVWADYGISKVRYDSEHNHIVQVMRRKDLGESFGEEEIRIRQQVVSDLKGDTTYVTIILNSSGKWDKGSDVGIVNVNGTDYIRTDGNQTAKDNLGNLPEF